MSTYDFKTIEEKWQRRWEKEKSFKTPAPSSERPPYYILEMFPYPSGHLHMGHVRNYTIGDVLARFHRRQGRSVLHPIGWDAFGLPAENAAIERGIHPSRWTWDNIDHMRGQLKELGISYDWDREVATCDPAYYRWNQWIFIKMFEKGLVYRKKAPVNWCPKDRTVLANEQVHEGRCWRCKTEVVQKELEQWFFKITAYAEELLSAHEQLRSTAQRKGWPEEVITMQRNWIGQSWGAFVDFPVVDENNRKTGDVIRVFTTRPDTLFGATFMAVAPEYSQIEKITTADRKKAVEAYRNEARKLTKVARTAASREKTGEFTGAIVENPVNGAFIPVWTADYVLTDYGTGAIMAVPAHDQRDFEFAQKFRIPIVQVIEPADAPLKAPLTQAFEGDGVLINSGPYNGLPVEEAKKKITEDLAKRGVGSQTKTFKLRDWLLSRQRYWGTPIPAVYCDHCGTVMVHLNDLPVKLPDDVQFTGKGESPLAQAQDWLKTTCPKCNGPALRETDTMDTFVDSSWYYARYTDPKNNQKPFDPSQANTWIPVHQYVGGIEHACMHLIYSRFFHKVLRDMDFVKSDEPFAALLTQGMVTLGGSAMSKSRGNVVDPKTVIVRYGADTCRLFILFAAPPTQQLEWSDQQVEGIWRFLNRVWRLVAPFSNAEGNAAPKRFLDKSATAVSPKDLMRSAHQTILKVTDDIQKDFGFNTAISSIMELVNHIYLYADLGDEPSRFAVETVVQLLEPFAPHLCEELWSSLGHTTPLLETKWPKADPSFLVSEAVQIVVQVNGKVRDRISVPANAAEDDVKSVALESLSKRGIKITPERVIYVNHKLVNFVESKN